MVYSTATYGVRDISNDNFYTKKPVKAVWRI